MALSAYTRDPRAHRNRASMSQEPGCHRARARKPRHRPSSEIYRQLHSHWRDGVEKDLDEVLPKLRVSRSTRFLELLISTFLIKKRNGTSS